MRRGHIADRRLKLEKGDTVKIKRKTLKGCNLTIEDNKGIIVDITFDTGQGKRGTWLIDVRLTKSGSIFCFSPSDLVREK